MASPIKRQRRTNAEIEGIRTSIYEVVEAGQPMPVRQVFYQLVTMGVIDKTENEYTSTVGRLVTKMRMAKELPFGWIADNTRWMRKARTHSNLRSMLDLTRRTYRRALWDNQDAYVEVWLEKDALAGVVNAPAGRRHQRPATPHAAATPHLPARPAAPRLAPPHGRQGHSPCEKSPTTPTPSSVSSTARSWRDNSAFPSAQFTACSAIASVCRG